MKYINNINYWLIKTNRLFVFLLVLFVFKEINITAQVQRNPVLEYGTGTWCGSCACGHVIINHTIMPSYPNAVIISYHGYATSSDPFARFEGNEIIDSLGIIGYPSGVVDRTMSPANLSACGYIIGDRNRVPANVGIDLKTDYNSADRNYKINLAVFPTEQLDGEFYIQLILTEDSITAAQVGDGDDCPGGSEFVFNNICRKVLTGAVGDLIPISGSWMPGDTMRFSYTYNLPAEYNEINCKIAALVYKKGVKFNLSQIQQAEQIKLIKPVYKPLNFITPNKLSSIIQISKNYKIRWSKETPIENISLDLINRDGVLVENLLTNSNTTEFIWTPNESLRNNYCRLVLTANGGVLKDTSNEFYLKSLNLIWQKSNIVLPKNNNVVGYTAAINNNYLYVFGGDSSGNGTGLSNSVYYSKINVDGSLNPFLLLTFLPHDFAYGSSFVYNNFIYLFGDGDNKNFMAEISDSGLLENWQELQSFPLSLINVKAVINGNRIFAMGLFTDNISTYVNRTFYCDIQPNGYISDWTYLPGIPNTHIGGEAVICDSVIYYIGGKGIVNNNYVTTNMVHYAKITSAGIYETWARSNFPINTNNHSGTVIINKSLFVAGGVDSNNIPLECYQGELLDRNILWFGSYNLPDPTEYAGLVYNNGFLYYLTGFGSNSIYIAKIDDSLTAVTENNKIPNDFILYNNYPNPFNPATTISYFLNKNSNVTLKVYDVLGKEISVLVNDNLPAGKHKYKFSGNGLSSGVYFYQIDVSGKIKTGKMILIK